MEITGLSDSGDYDFEEDDALKDAVWNGRKVKIIENYRYSPQMQRFRLAPNLIQDRYIMNCDTKSSVSVNTEVSKEPGERAKGEFSLKYQVRSEDGKTKIGVDGKVTSDGEVRGSFNLEREF